MAGDTPYEAVAAFVDPIQQAISCFVSGKVTADRADPDGEGRLLLNRNDRTKLPGDARIAVELGMRYRIVRTDAPDRGPWKVSTLQWIYHLFRRDEPLIQYHWHPDTNVWFPHLHLGDGGVHHPTGRVLIEDVLTAAVEYGAEPLDADRWAEIHRLNHEKFQRGSTWGASSPIPPPPA